MLLLRHALSAFPNSNYTDFITIPVMAKKNIIEKKAPNSRSMLNIHFIIESDLPGISGVAGISTNNFPVPDKNKVRLKLRAFPMVPGQDFSLFLDPRACQTPPKSNTKIADQINGNMGLLPNP